MKKRRRIVGKVYGQFTVLAEADFKYGRQYVKCRCVCGVVKDVRVARLLQGESRSCGCVSGLFRPRHTTRGWPVGFFEVFNLYRRNARVRGLGFELKEETFLKLITSNCYYCGAVPVNKAKRQRLPRVGVDRLNNEKHYTEDNCVPCCRECNRIKGPRTFDEFIGRLRRIVENTKRHQLATDGASNTAAA